MKKIHSRRGQAPVITALALAGLAAMAGLVIDAAGMPCRVRSAVNSSQVRVGEIFKEAIRKNASALIVIHNHPSGDPTPSPDDVAVTRAIVQAGKLLDVEVLDHLVIGHGRWVSLKERGLGFA
jgi:hypothetical protein